MENIATRAAYGEALAAMAKDYPELVVLDADLGNSTMSRQFQDKYPQRYFEMGIAEADMTSTAAGLAAWGGLSVHCQTMAVTEGLSLRWHWAGKALQAGVSVLLALPAAKVLY